jgi:hypothetical protein
MGHLRKTKTSRRVKRTKTDKRNNTQKRRQNQTFRKNRRVNKGGNGTGKRNREEEMHDQEKKAMDAEKDENNMKKQYANKKNNTGKNKYREPIGEGYSKKDELVVVDPASQLEITKMQNRFDVDMDAEDETNGPIWFGGKRKSHNKK